MAKSQIISTSDERLKKDIIPLVNSLERLSHLNGVSFLWRDRDDDQRKIGLIAQDVAAVFPELVDEDRDGFLHVDYMGFIAPVIDAVNELDDRTRGAREVEERSSANAERIAELEARIAQLEELLADTLAQ